MPRATAFGASADVADIEPLESSHYADLVNAEPNYTPVEPDGPTGEAEQPLTPATRLMCSMIFGFGAAWLCTRATFFEPGCPAGVRYRFYDGLTRSWVSAPCCPAGHVHRFYDGLTKSWLEIDCDHLKEVACYAGGSVLERFAFKAVCGHF